MLWFRPVVRKKIGVLNANRNVRPLASDDDNPRCRSRKAATSLCTPLRQ